MIKETLPSVIVLIVLSLVQLSSQQPVHRVCYVKPDNSTAPCPSPCYTLQEYADNKAVGNCRFSSANTTYIFLSGVHELFQNISLNFFRTESVLLVGNSTENPSPAEIFCFDQAGFLFRNSTNIVIKNLTFTGCGHWYGYMVLGGQATLAFNNVTNVTVASTTVRNSTGHGLYALCAMGYVEVVNSVFAFNEGTADYDGGNVGFRYQDCINIDTPSFLSIRFSHFLYGYSEHINPLATGLSVFVWSNGVNVEIDNITAIGNAAGNKSTGGNVALFLRNRTNIISNWILVNNSYIADGHAYFGAGMFASLLDTPPYDTTAHQTSANTFSATNNVLTPEVITIVNTQFISNHAVSEGGGLYVLTHEEAGIFSPIGNVTIRDCNFYNNTLSAYIGGGVALHLNNHYVLSYLNHSVPQFYTSVVNCTIENNVLIVEEDINLVNTVFTGSSAVFIIRNPTGVLLEDCRILHNECTGITTVSSSVVFAGNVTVAHNEGTDGGGIILCDNSYMMFKANTTLVLQENVARHAGGGIYAEDACLQSEPPCFFQLDIEIYRDPSLQDTVHIQLINNTANYSGSAIYGGSVDFCYLFPQFTPDLKRHGAAMFKYIFEIIHSPSDLSPISSDPYQVCFCSNNNSWPECSIRSIERHTYPGEQFSFYALTVGQRDGSASRTVLANLQNLEADSQLGALESSQVSHWNCTEFNYTVYSILPSEVIMLSVQHLGISSGIRENGIARVSVTFRQCPIGFAITTHSPYKCDCVPMLKVHGIICDIQHQIIHRLFPTWIGYHHYHHHNSSSYQFSDNNSDYGIVFHSQCPYDFCKDSSVAIKTGPNISSFQGDLQCAYRRAGILCGECKNGYSLILGNSECRKCSNTDLSLLLVFIVAGLLLVLLLILTDLNVSSGTMSGLIFYANIVQVNRAIFFNVSFPSGSIPVYLCSIFIAWLNLDFGIEACFYSGMDAYTKTWLQFAFPLYVWGIAIVIILLSRRFPSMAGRNPVRVLATLFLLSYAKLLRTIIAALAPTHLNLPTADGSTTVKLVWREDGNVDYLRGRHIPLFVVALGFGLVTFPYAIVLFLVQWLQKASHHCVCSWVIKLKPLFDAYTGPYKIHCRFWTGFLLLIRVVIFVAFTFPSANPDLKLSLIISTCIVVQMIAWSFRGIFESMYTEILNSVFLLNLGLFSAATSYTSRGHGNQTVVIYTSVGIAWILFNCILTYRTFLQIKSTKKWHRLQVWFSEKQQVWCPHFMKSSGAMNTDDDGNSDGENGKKGVTHSTIDPFSVQYREPLISSSSSYYGTSD